MLPAAQNLSSFDAAFLFYIAFVLLKSNFNFMYANFALLLIKLFRGYYLTLNEKRLSRHHMAIIELLKMLSRHSSQNSGHFYLAYKNTIHRIRNLIQPYFYASHNTPLLRIISSILCVLPFNIHDHLKQIKIVDEEIIKILMI